VSTKGLEFYLDEKNVIWIDTEGFYQPLDDDEPGVKQDFILNFMSNWCDVLVIVIERTLTHELELINKILRHHLMVRNFQQIYVLHNVKSLNNFMELKALVEVTRRNMTRLYGTNIQSDNDFQFKQYLTNTLAIKHIFIGNINHSKLFQPQIQDIQNYIKGCNSSLRVFNDILEESIKSLISKYYEYSNYTLCVKDGMYSVNLENEHRKIFSNEMTTRLGMRVSYDWVKMNEFDNEVYLIFNLSQFILINVMIKDPNTINLSGIYREISQKKIHLYSEDIFFQGNLLTHRVRIRNEMVEPFEVLGADVAGSILIKFNADSKINIPVIDQSVLDEFQEMFLGSSWVNLIIRENNKQMIDSIIKAPHLKMKEDDRLKLEQL
jgi:hypothetical protein